MVVDVVSVSGTDGFVNVAKFAACVRWFSTFRQLFDCVRGTFLRFDVFCFVVYIMLTVYCHAAQLAQPWVLQLMSCGFFHAFISRSTRLFTTLVFAFVHVVTLCALCYVLVAASEQLLSLQLGAYLVRFSSQPSRLALSYVERVPGTASALRNSHSIVTRTATGLYIMQMAAGTVRVSTDPSKRTT